MNKEHKMQVRGYENYRYDRNNNRLFRAHTEGEVFSRSGKFTLKKNGLPHVLNPDELMILTRPLLVSHGSGATHNKQNILNDMEKGMTRIQLINKYGMPNNLIVRLSEQNGYNYKARIKLEVLEHLKENRSHDWIFNHCQMSKSFISKIRISLRRDGEDV